MKFNFLTKQYVKASMKLKSIENRIKTYFWIGFFSFSYNQIFNIVLVELSQYQVLVDSKDGNAS